MERNNNEPERTSDKSGEKSPRTPMQDCEVSEIKRVLVLPTERHVFGKPKFNAMAALKVARRDITEVGGGTDSLSPDTSSFLQADDTGLNSLKLFSNVRDSAKSPSIRVFL